MVNGVIFLVLNTTERFRASREAEQSQPRCVTQPPPESGTFLLQGRRKPYSGFSGVFVLFRSFHKEPCSPLQNNCLKKSSPGCVLLSSSAPFFLKGC